MTTRDVKVQICSDLDYKNLIAEIYIGGSFAALISQERGPEHLMIEFPESQASNENRARAFCLDDFVRGLNKAKAALTRKDA